MWKKVPDGNKGEQMLNHGKPVWAEVGPWGGDLDTASRNGWVWFILAKDIHGLTVELESGDANNETSAKEKAEETLNAINNEGNN